MENTNKLILTRTDYQCLAALIATLNHESAELLEGELSRALVVANDEVPADVVTMNSRVQFQDLESGKELAVTLVYPRDANIEEGKVSVLAPVGAALIGLRVGQVIRWPLPGGREKSLKVITVQSGPELRP